MSEVWNFLVSEESDPYKRGIKFEKIYTRKYLNSHPLFSKIYKKILLWEEWDDRPFKTDIGIDLVCIGFDNKITAVQAKAYNPNSSISKPDIDSFITASNSNLFSYRLLIGTTDKIGKNAKAIINNEKRIPFQTHLLTDLEESNFVEICKSKSKSLKTSTKLNPYPHQIKAIAECEKHFKNSDKGQLIMACGSGKTLTSFWITKQLKSKKVLFLAPSISLLAQTLNVWLKNSSNKDTNFFVVCSDQSAGQNTEIEYASDYDFPSSTNQKELSNFIDANKEFVIFSTYQSSKTVLDAAKKNKVIFDITICDEAHRLTGNVNNDFGVILKPNFPTKKKLFMTATPRIISYGIQKAAEERKINLVSMDNKNLFGNIIYELTFGEAIEKKLLADYKIIVSGVTNKDLNQKEFVKFKSKTIDISTYAKAITLKKILNKHKLKKVITFHSFLKSASTFSELLNDLKLNSNFISGYHNIRERKQLVKKLENKSKNVEVLSNARVLSEGIDLPQLDCIAFIDPKTSVVDIVQAVGRAIRASKDRKKVGYIVIPIYLDNKKGFETIYKTIIAMRSHDARMAEELDNYRVKIGNGANLSNLKLSNFVIDLPSYVDKELEIEIISKTINAASESWYFWFGLLEKYIKENGTPIVPQTHFQDGLALGHWVSIQRRNYKSGTLDDKRTNLLNNLNGWIWDINEHHFELGLKNAKQFYDENQHWNIPFSYVSPDGFKLGQWARNYRSKNLERQKKVTKEKRKRFKEIGFPLEVESVYERKRKENFKELEIFYKKNKNWNVDDNYITKNGIKLKNIIAGIRRSKNKLNKEELKFLNSINFIWSVEEESLQRNLDNLRMYIAKNGHSLVPKHYVAKDGSKLGNWVSSIRYGQVKISKDLKNQLDLMNFRWDLKDIPSNYLQQQKSFNRGFAQLKKYYDKEKTASISVYFVDNDNFKLGDWVGMQRRKYKSNKLMQEHIDLLESLNGWEWEVENKSFELGFQQLEKHYFNQDNFLGTLPIEDEDKFLLRAWASRQRRKYRAGMMSKETIQRFEKLNGWEWNPKGKNQYSKN